ncbi:MAG: hypothetical protein RBR16_08125 [Syntrophus sp. (in: bacteria)]|nr:hypothetical protein [Syntrophus sp. (in: bacteria)]
MSSVFSREDGSLFPDVFLDNVGNLQPYRACSRRNAGWIYRQALSNVPSSRRFHFPGETGRSFLLAFKKNCSNLQLVECSSWRSFAPASLDDRFPETNAHPLKRDGPPYPSLPAPLLQDFAPDAESLVPLWKKSVYRTGRKKASRPLNSGCKLQQAKKNPSRSPAVAFY